MDPAEQRKKFMKLCKAATDNDTAVLQLIEKRFSKADTNFLASQECALALQHAANEIKGDRNNKFVYIKKFMSLLKANTGKKRKNNDREHESDSSEPTAKRHKKVGNNEYSDGSESGPGGGEKHKSKEREKKKQVTQRESDSDTEPLVITTDDIKQLQKSDKKPKSEENAKKKQVDSESDTEPLSINNIETIDTSKSGRKSNSTSPTAKQVKGQSPTKDCPDDQQLTILPLTPVKKSSPEKPDTCVPASYVSPTARYKYCHVAELRLTDDKSSTTSVKISNDNIITHIPRRKVARIVLNPLTPEKLPNGKTAVMIPKDSRRTPEHSVQGDRSPAAAVKSPGPEYVYVNFDSSQEVVCEKGKKAVDDGDIDVLSDGASIPDDKDADDQPEEDEQEDEVLEDKPEQEDEEEDGPAPVKGSKKQLKKLEVLLDKISREIRKLENRELTLDELEDDNSAYAMEDRYKKKFCKVWDKYCEVAGRPPTTGRPTERRFRFEGTRYPEVNKKIERFVNKKHIFPDYHDIRDIIGKCNKKFQLRLKSSAADNLAREAFTVVGNELQKRRMLDFSDDFESRLDEPIRPYSDPALYDRGLRDKLDKNKKTFKSRMSDVLEKYARKQDDGDDGEDSEEEEEENEEDAQSEDEAEKESSPVTTSAARGDIEKMFILPITSPAKIKAAAESEQKPSTSQGPEDGVSPKASIKKPAETPAPTEQDSFMSAFGLQVRPRQTESPPKAEKKDNLEDKLNTPPQVSRCVIMEKKEEKSAPTVSSTVNIDEKGERSIPQVSTDVNVDKKDKQSIPQVSRDVDVNKVEQSLPQVYMDVDIDEKDEESIPRVDIDLVKEDKESIPQINTKVGIDEKGKKCPTQACKDADVVVEDKKSAPQVYQEVDIDEDLENDQNLDDDEENQRQVYKELDIDEEMDVDYESDNNENQRQVYKELDIDEDLGVVDEIDDDEENQRQVYKELDIDEMSDGDISQRSSPVKCLDTDRPDSVESKKRDPEVADCSQDLFEDSNDNDVHNQKMGDSQSPKIISYEEKSSSGTKRGSISSPDVLPKALTYIDVADEESCDVNINGVITHADVVEVIASDVIHLSDDSTSKLAVSGRESIESLESVDNHRTEKSPKICNIKQGGKGTEQGNDSKHFYAERGTLSQPINIEDSQQSDNDSDKAEKQRDSVKTLNHKVNESHIERESGKEVSDYRRSRLKLQKHKTNTTQVDSQTVENCVSDQIKAASVGNAFVLGTVTVVHCSSDEDEVPTKKKAPNPDLSVKDSCSTKQTDLSTHNNLSSNVTRVSNPSDTVKLKSSSVTYTNVAMATTKGLEKCSPVNKNVAKVGNRNLVNKTETLKKSPTPDRKVRAPEKGSPMAPIDVDKNTETPQSQLKALDKGSPTAPINVDENTQTPDSRIKAPEKGSPAKPIDVDENGQDDSAHVRRVGGTINQPINVLPMAPISVDENVQTPDRRVKAPEKGSPAKPIDVDENGQDDSAQVRRVGGTINQPINVDSSCNKGSPQSTQRRKVYSEAERGELNKSTHQTEKTQRRIEGSPNSSKSNNSSDVIEIDDDGLVGSPEKTAVKLPNVGSATRGQRPNAPVTALNAQRPASQVAAPAPKPMTVVSQPPVTAPYVSRPITQLPVPAQNVSRPTSKPPIQALKVARHPSQLHLQAPNVSRPASQPYAQALNVTRSISQPFISRPPSQPLLPASNVTKPLPKPLIPAPNVARPLYQPPGPAPKVSRPSAHPSVPAPNVSRPAVQQPTQAPNVSRPTSQPPVQTVDLTSPESKKKFDPKATINIMNKVLAQSKSTAPAVFTQTIADMISKVSADVFNEKSKKQNIIPGNQSSRSAGNRRQNVGTSGPGGANRASGGANHAAGSAPRTMTSNRASMPNRTPISPSQSNSRHRLNMNRVLPKSRQTNQAAPVQVSGQQKITGYKNGVTYHNTQSLPNTANPSRTGTGPNQKSRAGPPQNNAATDTANPRPMLLVQNTSNMTQPHSNTNQNSHVKRPSFNNTVGNRRPGVGPQRPMADNQRPMADNQRPMAGNQRSVVGNQRPVVGNQTQVGANQRPVSSRVKLVSPRAGTTGRSYTLNRHGVVVSPRSNRPLSASSLRIGQRPNGANTSSKHLSPKRLLYPGSAPSRQVGSGQGRERPSEVDFQQSVRNKALTSTPRPSRSPIQPQQIAIGQEGGLKITSYSSLATGMTIPVQSASQKRPASRPPTTGNVARRQEGAKKPKIETVVLSDSD